MLVLALDKWNCLHLLIFLLSLLAVSFIYLYHHLFTLLLSQAGLYCFPFFFPQSKGNAGVDEMNIWIYVPLFLLRV